MQIHEVTEPLFREYGKVMDNVDVSAIVEVMMTRECPKEGTIYVASDKELESLPVAKEVKNVLYGEVDIEIGYCNGHNNRLNALEYHRCSEINIACGEDAVLILGKQTDVEEDYTYDTSKAVAFRIPKGVAVEVYATTLHYAPCHVTDEGFRVAVVLSKGTNEPLSKEHLRGCKSNDGKINEDCLLMAKNKWLIGHAEGGLDEGAYIGLKGENLTC
ncbi:MAG TPA: DUF4867 family protein [Lachnospiraceae bacterium]